MKIIRNAFSLLFAILLALTPLLTCLIWIGHSLIFETVLYEKPGQAVRAEQLSRLQTLIQDLSSTYGFDAQAVLDSFDDDQLSSYAEQVREFLQGVLQHSGDEEAEEPYFPYFMWDNGVDQLLADEGFSATVSRQEKRSTAQDILTVLEKTAQQLIFPLRPPLVMMVFNRLAESGTFQKAVHLLEYWYSIPAAALLLMLLILLLTPRESMGYLGAGLTAGSLILGMLLLFLPQLGILTGVSAVNPLFARYLATMAQQIFLPVLLLSLLLLFIGILLLWRQRRKA